MRDFVLHNPRQILSPLLFCLDAGCSTLSDQQQYLFGRNIMSMSLWLMSVSLHTYVYRHFYNMKYAVILGDSEKKVQLNTLGSPLLSKNLAMSIDRCN